MHKYFDIFNRAFLSLFLDEVIEVDGFALCFSHTNKKKYWNAANKIDINESEVNETIVDIELLFSYHSLTPTVWVSPFDKPHFMETALKDKGYMLRAVDSWMLLENPREMKVTNTPLHVVQVQDEDQLNDFIQVFDDTWKDKDGTYSTAFRKKIFDERYKDKSKIYVGYEGNRPVSIGGIVFDEKNSIMHSVATVEDRRGRGFSKQVVQEIIYVSNADNVIIQVEKDDLKKKIFYDLGFKDLMDVKIMCKA